MAYFRILQYPEARVRGSLREAEVRRGRGSDVEGWSALVLAVTGRQERQDLPNLEEASRPFSRSTDSPRTSALTRTQPAF